jgi:zinc protease
VLLSGVRFGGQSLADEGDIVNARFATAIVSAMGVRDFTPLDLQKTLAGKSATTGIGFGSLTEGVSGTAGSADVETMLQLLYLQLTAPRADPALFTAFLDKQKELARNNMARPETMLGDTVRSTLYSNHPRIGLVPRPEEFDGINLERVMSLYKERFGSARGMTFFIVGSFDLQRIKPLLATYLASLPTPDIPIAFKDRGVRPVRGVVRKEVRRGREAKSTISLTFAGDAPFSEAEQGHLQALVEVLNLKLTEVLREQKGLIYGGGAQATLARYPRGSYTVSINLPCGPENVDKVLEATFAEMRKLQENGPEAADLAKVKENWTSNYRRAIRENGYWLNQLQSAHMNGTDPTQILKFDQILARLGRPDVQAAARRYFDFNNYVQVVLYPDHLAEAAKLPPGETGK